MKSVADAVSGISDSVRNLSDSVRIIADDVGNRSLPGLVPERSYEISCTSLMKRIYSYLRGFVIFNVLK